jgi:hypothetical protein
LIIHLELTPPVGCTEPTLFVGCNESALLFDYTKPTISAAPARLVVIP